jgi:Flp pilus assembly pilin Flp
MTVDEPGTGATRPGWPQPTDADDLDLAFGPGTASVPVRTPRQRLGRISLIGVGVIVTAGVIAVVLITIIGGVQNGVGGVFPRPQAALDRFGSVADHLDGVQRVRNEEPTKTSFASYDVLATVAVQPTLTEPERTAVVDALSDAAQDASGNGVRVFAVADLGTLEVGVSADGEVTGKRLALARQLDAIGGVSGVRCSWSDDGPSDEAAAQTITVETRGTGNALGAVVAKATQEAHAVFPGATVESAVPGA